MARRRREPNPRTKRAVSRWTARAIPPILAGAVGYTTYVIISLLSINYLLREHNNPSAAAPILVTYFLLLILWTTTFARLWYMVTFDPPYLPLGPNAPISRKIPFRRTSSDGDGSEMYNSSGNVERQPNNPDSPGLENFYTKEVFITDSNGRPKWCSQCANWKPDRTHHCSDVGRCIYKMDHYCPWVGGPVGENNLKYFIQFTGYTALTCTHLVVVMAIYLHRQIVNKDEQPNPNFIAVIALAGFFGLFTASMTVTSGHMVAQNQTQIETLNAKTKIYDTAILKPHHLNNPNMLDPSYRWITYPLRLSGHEEGVDHQHVPPSIPNVDSTIAHGIPDSAHGRSTPSREATSSMSSNETPNDQVVAQKSSLASTMPHIRQSPRDLNASRTFIILTTKAGENPWDLGSYLRNWETVMGTRVVDWFLPIRRSPCCNHEGTESHFQFGPVVKRLKVAMGFIIPEEERDFRRTRPKPLRRRSKNRDAGETVEMDIGVGVLKCFGARGKG